MAILIIRNDHLVPVWKEALKRAAPDIPVFGMQDDFPQKEVRMAAIWKHPPGSLQGFSNLLGIHCLGAGVDFILEDDSIPTDLPVMRVVDPFLASDMAEYVLAHIMGFLKQVYGYKENQLHGLWKPVPYRRIGEVTVGIMGLGKLGRAVAQLLKANGFALAGWTRSSVPSVDFPVFRGEAQKNAFLEKADILVCLLPLTPETRGSLNLDLFRTLPEQAFLINVARGPLLVDEDLLTALEEGRLSGACLDVFHREPLPDDHPFWKHPLVHMTPHVASVSDPDSVAPQIAANYRRLLMGETPDNLVIRSRGY